MDVYLWDKLDSTPYGRQGKLVPNVNMPPYSLANRVTFSQYGDAPRGYEELLRELPRGKRCFGGGASSVDGPLFG